MFVPIAAKIVTDLVIQGEVSQNPTVVELGNQTYSIDPEMLRNILNTLENKKELVNKCSIDFSKLTMLSKRKAARKPKEEGVPEVREFFEALGFKEYQAVDINESFGSLVMDLNKDIQREYGFDCKYDLVTNIGVSEHLIGQANFMLNAHNLTKQGGVIMHILPFLGYVNHGFFNYQPRFFQDLASANDYEILGLYLAERDRIIMDLNKPSELPVYFYQYLHLLLNDERYSGLVVAILRKKSSADFQLPLQGKYLKDLANANAGLDQYYKQKEHLAVTKGFFKLPAQMPMRIRVKAKLLKIVSSVLKSILKYA